MRTEEGDVDDEEVEEKKKQKTARSVWAYTGCALAEASQRATALINPILTGRLPNDIMGFRRKSRKGQMGKNHWAASSAKG